MLLIHPSNVDFVLSSLILHKFFYKMIANRNWYNIPLIKLVFSIQFIFQHIFVFCNSYGVPKFQNQISSNIRKILHLKVLFTDKMVFYVKGILCVAIFILQSYLKKLEDTGCKIFENPFFILLSLSGLLLLFFSSWSLGYI